MMMNVLERFDRFDGPPQDLARQLLGQRLVRIVDGERMAGTIVETEAYLGVLDKAAHAFGGRRTERNESMYRAGGHAYVYFIYGMHFCMNVVCGTEDEPVAVLIRGLEPTEGLTRIRANRAVARRDDQLCSGPARLTSALEIDRTQDGIDLRTHPELFIERARQRSLPSRLIGVSARIGVEYAGDWAKRQLRFYIKESPHVSRLAAR